MKALSICQPFASAILTGQKTEECRTWPTPYRGPLVIHAPKKLWTHGFSEYPNFRPDRVIRSAYIGIVDLTDCVQDCYTGEWLWLVERPRWLTRPVPAKGRLGLWKVELPADVLPADELAAIR